MAALGRVSSSARGAACSRTWSNWRPSGYLPSCKHRILIAMQGLFSVSNDGSVDCHAGKHIFQSPLPCHLLFHVPRIIVSIVEKMSQFVHRRAVSGWGVNPPEHDSVAGLANGIAD